MSLEAELLQRAEELARTVETWAALSNALFDPMSGLVTRAYPTRAQREAFVKTEEYRRICQLIDDAQQRFGLVAGATPKARGRMVVNVPLSLQGALEREARAEGVSVDQLIVAKLAARLSAVVLK